MDTDKNNVKKCPAAKSARIIYIHIYLSAFEKKVILLVGE